MSSSDYTAVTKAILARAGESIIDPRLDRIQALLDLLGQPQRNYPVVHLTGTNGKTSTARMIDALLRQRQLRVGRYTSPHLTTMRERIVVDGEPVSEEEFTEIYSDIEPMIAMVDAQSDVPLSFFEVLTAMAYAAFADAPVDVAVVEVGLGGSWDATNVVDADIAVVNPIDLDHSEYLPDTVEGIAEEKAGIIKANSVAILAEQRVHVAEVLLERIAAVGATVAREGMEFGVLHRDVAVGGQLVTIRGLRGEYSDVLLPLHGEYQARNAAVAIAAVEAFSGPEEGEERLDPELVRDALAGTESPGRLEVVRRSPTIIVDSAHNPAGMAATAAAVEEGFSFDRLIGLVAVLADKDVEGILEPLEPLLTDIVVARNSSPRSLEPERLAALAAEMFGEDRVHIAERLDDAIELAVTLAEDTGQLTGHGVLVTGSVVTAGDVRHLLGGGE